MLAEIEAARGHRGRVRSAKRLLGGTNGGAAVSPYSIPQSAGGGGGGLGSGGAYGEGEDGGGGLHLGARHPVVHAPRRFPTSPGRQQRAAFTAAKTAAERNAMRDTMASLGASALELPAKQRPKDPRLEIEGVYACNRRDSSAMDELARHVTVTLLRDASAAATGAAGGGRAAGVSAAGGSLVFKWENHAGVAWTLTAPPLDASGTCTQLLVGTECPFQAHGYTQCAVVRSKGATGTILGLEGPGGMQYARRGAVGEGGGVQLDGSVVRPPRVVQRSREALDLSRGGQVMREA